MRERVQHPDRREGGGTDLSAKEPDEVVQKLLRDPKFLRAAKGLCPKKGEGLESVTITVDRTGQSVTLTPETRAKVIRMLREQKKEGDQP